MGDSDDLSNSFLTYFVLPVAFCYVALIFSQRVCVCVCARFFLLSSVSLSRLFILCSSAIVLVHLCSSTTRWFVISYKKKRKMKTDVQREGEKKKSRSAARYLFFLNCVSYLDCASCTYYILYVNVHNLYIYLFFFFGHLPYSHTNAFTIERIIYISFFTLQFLVFVVSLVRFRVWNSPVDSAQNVIIKLNIASITHSQLILVSCFIFFPFLCSVAVYTSLLSFSSDRYNVGDLLCFQIKRGKTCVFCIRQKFHRFCCDRFLFISLETFIKCHFYDDEKSSQNENLRFSQSFVV